MRSIHSLLLPVVLLALVAVPAWAEEDPAPPADAPKPAPKAEPKADPKMPLYSIEFLMPVEDDEMEDGWKLTEKEAPGAPSEGVLSGMCKSCELTDENFYVETDQMENDGARKPRTLRPPADSITSTERRMSSSKTSGVSS